MELKPVIQAVVFDRDGTLIEHIPYLSSPEEVRLLPEVRSGITRLIESGVKLFLHTNQSGVGRGMFEMCDVHACNARMIELLDCGKDVFRRICIAPEHPDQAEQSYRKPSPKFVRELMAEYGWSAEQICYVGDRASDLETAAIAGTRAVGVDTGQNSLVSELSECDFDHAFPVETEFSGVVARILT